MRAVSRHEWPIALRARAQTLARPEMQSDQLRSNGEATTASGSPIQLAGGSASEHHLAGVPARAASRPAWRVPHSPASYPETARRVADLRDHAGVARDYRPPSIEFPHPHLAPQQGAIPLDNDCGKVARYLQKDIATRHLDGFLSDKHESRRVSDRECEEFRQHMDTQIVGTRVHVPLTEASDAPYHEMTVVGLDRDGGLRTVEADKSKPHLTNPEQRHYESLDSIPRATAGWDRHRPAGRYGVAGQLLFPDAAMLARAREPARPNPFTTDEERAEMEARNRTLADMDDDQLRYDLLTRHREQLAREMASASSSAERSRATPRTRPPHR